MRAEKEKTILIYASAPWIFRATLIGHLYEIAKVFPVILAAEKPDQETLKVLQNKDFFPFLEKIIFIRNSSNKDNLFLKNKYFYDAAKDLIEIYNPAAVITITDTYLFDMYLIRLAKKAGAVTAIIQPSLHSTNLKLVSKIVDLASVYSRLPKFLPFSLRLAVIKIRKYFGYFLFNIIFPILNGEKPFFGTSIAIYSPSGFRADYYIAYSKEEYKLNIEEGLPPGKIHILKHPLCRADSRKFFEEAFFKKSRQNFSDSQKALTLLFPDGDVYFKEDFSPIFKKEVYDNAFELIKTIAEILDDWKIFIKMHPDRIYDKDLQKRLLSISADIEVTRPEEPMDKFIERSLVIVGLASPSTAIFTASLQQPEKAILSVNLHKELKGDFFKGFAGVEYIDNREKLIKILEMIKIGEYRKKQRSAEPFEGGKEFLNSVEAVNFLLRKNENI